MPYRNLRWICPYYSYDEKTCVHCEFGSKVKFPGEAIAKAYYAKFCANTHGWKQCTIAKSIDDYYEEVENGEK